jgi:CubicO group peptidase (beta-lactamase class C family)
MKKVITPFLSFTMLAFAVNAQTSVQNLNKLTLEIDAVVKPIVEAGDLNGNILVVKDGKPIYEQSFGFTDGSKESSLTADSKFNIGSIFKELPAVAIMQLQEKGLLKVTDNASTFLPELPKWAETISIENLLQYTAGLPRISWGKYAEITDEVLMNSLMEMEALPSQSGESYVYTNYSPYLLSKIVEKVSEQNFTDYAAKNIFDPAGMSQSIFQTSLPYEDRTGMAVSFNGDFKEDAMPFKIKLPLFLFSTTARDLFKLNEAMHNHKLISESSLLAIAQSADLETENKQSPMGNVEITNGKITEHQHHGSSGNYESLLYRNNAKNVTIILMTNRRKQNLHGIVDQINELL